MPAAVVLRDVRTEVPPEVDGWRVWAKFYGVRFRVTAHGFVEGRGDAARVHAREGGLSCPFFCVPGIDTGWSVPIICA